MYQQPKMGRGISLELHMHVIAEILMKVPTIIHQVEHGSQ